MLLISKTTLTSSSTTVTISSIPQTFRHLTLKMFARTNSPGFGALRYSGLYVSPPALTTQQQAMASIEGNFQTISANDSIYASFQVIPDVGQTGTNASTFAAAEVNYINYKGGSYAAGSNMIGGFITTAALPNFGLAFAGNSSTAAVTSIVIANRYSGENIAAGTTFWLYGIA
jgi:hypothetical protein